MSNLDLYNPETVLPLLKIEEPHPIHTRQRAVTFQGRTVAYLTRTPEGTRADTYEKGADGVARGWTVVFAVTDAEAIRALADAFARSGALDT